MWIFWLFVPFISIGINIHYLSNYPEDFARGLVKSFTWVVGTFLFLILLIITGNMD